MIFTLQILWVKLWYETSVNDDLNLTPCFWKGHPPNLFFFYQVYIDSINILDFTYDYGVNIRLKQKLLNSVYFGG